MPWVLSAGVNLIVYVLKTRARVDLCNYNVNKSREKCLVGETYGETGEEEFCCDNLCFLIKKKCKHKYR